MKIAAKTTKLLASVAGYYSAKLAEHGQVPQGVDWNGQASQALRFEQLCKVIQQTKRFSLNDLGCGYGALYEFLSSRYGDYTYNGYDISQDMVEAAQDRYRGKPGVSFTVADAPQSTADYSIASGIFNVRLGHSYADWRSYIRETLDALDRTSQSGFAFNCLTSYSDKEKMRDYLYYASPSKVFDLCKRRYSQHVALLHDYGLYEFTILVRKSV